MQLGIIRVHLSKADCLNVNPKSRTHQLCDPGQVLNLSVPSFFHLLSGDNAGMCLT